MASLEDMYNSGGGRGGGRGRGGRTTATNKTGRTKKSTSRRFGGSEGGLETYKIPPIRIRKGLRS
jgi:hypothetical protein